MFYLSKFVYNMTFKASFNIILFHSISRLVIQLLVSIIILYFSSRILGLKKWFSTIVSSILFTLINTLSIASILLFEVNFWLKFVILLFILKFIYKTSWSRSFILLLITLFISNIIKLLIPTLPTPI